jgi:tripartite-type tricarboxylate transporter receptor subunit TctC
MRWMLLALCVACSAATAQTWPTKPIRIISPHPPGGPGDIPFRGISQYLGPKYGQPIVVENRPGANAVIGAELCAKAPADGYTLCGTNNGTISLNPFAYSKLPYEPLKDFIGIVNIGAVESALVVNPNVPVKTAKELFDLVRAKPNSLSWSTIGVGSGGHLVLEWFRTQGIPFLHVPFKGGEQALNAVVAGQVDVALNASGRTAPMIKAGKLKALAVDGENTSQFIPGVPTLKELGYDTGNMRIWIGLFAPSATPRPIVDRLNADINGLLKNDEYVAKFLGTQGMVPIGGSVEQFNASLRTERDFYAKLIKDTGVKLGE